MPLQNDDFSLEELRNIAGASFLKAAEGKDGQEKYLNQAKAFLEVLQQNIDLAGRLEYSQTNGNGFVDSNGQPLEADTQRLEITMDKTWLGNIGFEADASLFYQISYQSGRRSVHEDKKAFLQEAFKAVADKAHELAQLPMPETKKRKGIFRRMIARIHH